MHPQRFATGSVSASSIPAPLSCPISQNGKITVRRLSDQAVYERFQLRARQAGLSTSFSPHDGRRTWIGNLLDAGVDIATVQQMAGHELTRPLGMTAEASDRNARLRVCCTSRGVSARPKAAPPRSL